MSDTEQVELDALLELSDDHRARLPAIVAAWHRSADIPLPHDLDLEGDYRRLKSKMEPYRPQRVITLPWAWAAAVILGAGIFWLLYPDRSKADVWVFTGPADGVELADASSVWLQDGAQLTVAFDTEQRVSKLEGTGFFVVSQEAGRPFVVKGDAGQVEVLGTSFEVQSLPGSMSVEVAEGRVRLSGSAEQSAVLMRGQTGLINGEQLTTGVVNHASGAWRLKPVVFDNAPLHALLDTLEQHYPVRFVATQHAALDCRASITLTWPDLQELTLLLETLFDLSVSEVAEQDETERPVRTLRLSGPGC